MKNLSRKGTQRESSHDRFSEIYRKALGLFVEKGYEATSTAMIAEALGMSKANLYYYCTSKENLLYKIHLDYLEKHLIPILEEAERIPDSRDRIAFFLRKFTLLNTSNKAGRVLIQEIHSLNRTHHNEIRLIWRKAYELLRNSIQELQKSGRARKLRESFLTFLGVGMANWTVYWFDYGRQKDAEELAETTVQIFLNGLLYPGNEKHF